MIPNSIRFKKEAARCEVAAKIASFLESNVSADAYDFALPDLLYFKSEEVLSALSKNTNWEVLEREFKANKGLISEDWE